MSYMEMELRNETGEASTKGICLNFGNFIDDLDFSSENEGAIGKSRTQTAGITVTVLNSS